MDQLIDQNKSASLFQDDENIGMSHNLSLSHESEKTLDASVNSQLIETCHPLTPDTLTDESLSENITNWNVSNPTILAELTSNDENDEDDKDILEILLFLIEGIENNWIWRNDIYQRLSLLLFRVVHKKVKLILLKNNFLHIAKIILRACDQQQMKGLIIHIITHMCCDDETIDFIGKDKKLVILILNNFKYRGDIALPAKVLELLLKIVQRIQEEPSSSWANYLINCEFLGVTITQILNKATNDDFQTATRLLQFTNEMIFLRTNFLVEKFRLDKLISGLLTCFIKVMPKRRRNSYSFDELTFIRNWLMLTASIRQRILYVNYKSRKFCQFMNIIHRILKKINVIKFKRDISVIHDIVNLLSSVRKISIKMGIILMNVIYDLRTTDFKLHESLENEILFQSWMHFLKHCDSMLVYKIIQSCKPEAREYFVYHMQSVSNT